MQFDNRDNSRYHTFTRRAALLGGAQALAFATLAGRMYYLQVLKSDEYRMLAEENRINVRLLAPLRGKIVDRFGRVLASNRQNYRAVMIPEQTDNIEETLDRLSHIVEITDYDRKKIMRDVKRSPRFLPITVAEDLTWDQFARVNVNEPDLPGVQPDVGETRHYPYGEELAHVVGYVSAVSEKELQAADGDEPILRLPGFRTGKQGIEKTFDDKLRGVPGSSHVEVNAYGRVIRELSKDPGQPGKEIVLTLDMEIQELAWNRMKGESASAVVMDIHSGDVLAFISTPAFDSNKFNMGYSTADYKALLDNNHLPLVNKALAGLYPPGSTFKPVVAMAAVDAGINPRETVFCPGYYKLGDSVFHCWRHGGHGNMNMHDAIKHSCDVYFYDVAKRIGIEKIAEMATRFGLGQTYDFDIPGAREGLVPTPGWKRAIKGEGWHQGETLIAGIGQGYLLASPLQLAVMVSRLANGGKAVVPRITRAVGGELIHPVEAPPIEVSQKGITIAQGGMDGVMNEIGGTAWRSRIPDEGMHMAGKTGTAQVRRISRAERASGVLKNEDLAWRQRDHALFICFAPVHAPKYAMSVVVEHGGSGSGVAAPIAHDIMYEVLKRDPTQRQAYLTPDAGVPRGRG